MAVKKTAGTEAEEILEEQEAPKEPEQEQEAPKEPDPWKRMVKVVSPRLPNNSDDYHFISVNDHRWQIPADGKTYEVPEPIAELLEAHIRAEQRADDYLKQVQENSFDPVLKPKTF